MSQRSHLIFHPSSQCQRKLTYVARANSILLTTNNAIIREFSPLMVLATTQDLRSVLRIPEVALARIAERWLLGK